MSLPIGQEFRHGDEVRGNGSTAKSPRTSKRVHGRNVGVPYSLRPSAVGPVPKTIPSYLKLVAHGSDLAVRPDADLAAWLTASAAFEELTGWPLHYASGAPKHEARLMWSAPVKPGVGIAPGHIKLLAKLGQDGPSPTLSAEVKSLATAIGGLWGEVLRTRNSLWQREAELAAGAPVRARADEAQHLAVRLEAVLAAGAESLGCQAAALYLLDAGTSELKLRASWGIARRQLTEPARPLRGAAADLEALLGHAVVMNDPALFDFWRVPQPCGAAVCVPVSSPTIPLGTLWMFADAQRDFSDQETNLLEIVAGKLAGDLERETLLGELDRAQGRHGADDAADAGQFSLPASPLLEGWEIMGWQSPCASKNRAWLDWFAMASDQFALVAGSATSGRAAGMATAAARAGARSASHYHASAGAVLRQLNAAMWAGDHGAAQAGLGYIKLDTHHGVLQAALSGATGLATIDARGVHRQSAPITAYGGQTLGGDEQISIEERQIKLPPGGSLVLWARPPQLVANDSDLARVAIQACQESAKLPRAEQASCIGRRLAEAGKSDGAWSAALVRRSRNA